MSNENIFPPTIKANQTQTPRMASCMQRKERVNYHYHRHHHHVFLCFWLVGICCSAIVIFTRQPLAGEGEGTSEAAFQFEQTECRTKKCCQQGCSEEGFTLFLILKILPGWIFFHISVIERMPATTTNCNIKDPETKPILSNGGGIWYHHHSQHHYWKICWLWLR